MAGDIRGLYKLMWLFKRISGIESQSFNSTEGGRRYS